MARPNLNIFPAHWTFSSPVGWGTFDPHTALVEDLFDAWVFAAEDARIALEDWVASPNELRSETFAVYRAALDREERAATVLRAAST